MPNSYTTPVTVLVVLIIQFGLLGVSFRRVVSAKLVSIDNGFAEPPDARLPRRVRT